MIRIGVVLSSIALTACSPGISTGEPLADLVVSREAGGWTECVTMGDRTLIFFEDDEGPPAMLHPHSFENEQVRAAAERIQMRWQDAPEPSSRTFGTVVGDRCAMHVNRPAISGDIAFVDFSDPGGEIGTYAFRRGGDQWYVVERVVNGYW
jgi:hypothetical protein